MLERPNAPRSLLRRHLSCHDLLRQIEHGRPPDIVSFWRYEAQALGQLSRVAPPSLVLNPSNFTDSSNVIRRPTRRSCITGLSPSEDGALLAVTSLNGHIELHEPPDISCPVDGVAATDATSHRLSIQPCDPVATTTDTCWHPRLDNALVVGLGRKGELWTYDLETCNGRSPSRVFTLGKGGAMRSATDLSPIAERGAVYVATDDGGVYVLDSRARNLPALLNISLRDPTITTADPLVFLCGQGCVKVHDVRAMTSKSSLSIAGRRDSGIASLSLKDIVVDKRGLGDLRGAFGFVQAVDGGTRVAFQMKHGPVGMLDTVKKSVDIVSEPMLEETEFVPPSDPLSDPSVGQELHSWHVTRRRGAVVRGAHGVGWRVVAPSVLSPGFRVVPFGGSGGKSFERRGVKRARTAPGSEKEGVLPQEDADVYESGRESENRAHTVRTPHTVACIAADEQLRRIFVGYSPERVDTFQMESSMKVRTVCEEGEDTADIRSSAGSDIAS